MNKFNPLCEKECSSNFTFESVNNAFKLGNTSVTEKIVNCFYDCFKSLFFKWAKITYKKYPIETIEFISATSFTDGVLKFKSDVETRGLYDGKATIKTILFNYFRNSILDNLQREKRLIDKKNKLAVVGIDGFENRSKNNCDDDSEILLLRLEQALLKLDPYDKQIIEWRHIEQKTNEEIALLLNITIPSATNRIYRCMERLKKIIEKGN